MEKWQTMSADAAEQILRRSRSELSPENLGKRSIRRRKRSKGADAAFKLPRVTPSESLLNIVSDASIPVFFIVTVVSAFLGHLTEAIVDLTFLALFILLSAAVNYYSRKRMCDMSRELMPGVRIRTEDGIVVCSADRVEVGDVIVFRQGDVLSADGRLLESNELVMLESATDRITADKTVKSFRKDAQVIYQPEMFASSFDNMVYAGSTVASGSGSAVVTSVGEETRAGRIYSGVNLARELVMPSEWMNFRKRMQRFSLAVLVGIVPAILIWIFTSGKSDRSSLDLFSAFILFVTLAATSMCDASCAASVFIFSRTIKKLKKEHDVSVIRPSVMESVSKTDLLFVLNPNCAADCRQLVRRSLYSGRDDPDASVRKGILGSFLVLGEAAERSPDVAEKFMSPVAVIKDYIGDGLPRESVLNKKYKIISVKADQPFRNCLTVIAESSDENGTSRNMITLSAGAEIIDYCKKYRGDTGEGLDLTDEKIDTINKTLTACTDAGQKVYVLLTASESESELTFEALFGIGISIPDNNGKEIVDLEKYGVTTVMMLRDNNGTTRRIAGESGIASDPRGIVIGNATHPHFTEIEAEMGRVFVGFGQDGLDALTRMFSDQKRDLLPVISDSAHLKAVASNGVVASVNGSSQDSVGVCSAIKFPRADSDNAKKGLNAIGSTIRACGSAILRLRLYSDYLLISVIIRLSAVIFPLVFGVDVSIPSVLTLLVTGLFGDFAAMFIFAVSSAVPNDNKVISEKENGITRFLRRFGMTVSGILAGLFVFVTAQLFLSSGIIEEDIMNWYTFSAISFSQMSLIGAVFVRWKKRRCSKVFNFVYPLIALAVAAFCGGIPILSKFVSFPFGILPYSEGAEFVGPIALIPAVLTVGFVLVSDMIGNFSSVPEMNK